MSSSLSNRFNFFSQITPERVQWLLRQPSTISVLASIGVHGLAWATLPLLPSQPERPVGRSQVRVVELSPAERLRLPETIPPLRSTNPLPPPDLSSLPPSFPIPSNTSPLYPIPFDSSPYPIPPDPPSLPSDSPSDAAKQAESDRRVAEEDRRARATEEDRRARAIEEDRRAKIAAEQAAEENRRKPYRFNPNNVALQDEPGQIGQLRKGTSDLQANLDRIAQNNREQDIALPRSQSIAYTAEACSNIPKAEQKKIKMGVTAIITPQGQPAEEPQVFISSGYEGLDQAAIFYVSEQIKVQASDEYKPNRRGQYRGVLQTIEFDPANCGS